jgi:hypothetical protein
MVPSESWARLVKMIFRGYWGCLPYVLIGTCLIVGGAISKTLINESEMPATEEEKASSKPPTLAVRILVILTGVASLIYGMRHWPR